MQTSGVLGYAGTNGVFSFQNTGAVGTKNSSSSIPQIPASSSKYTSLEGPEAGTYFRGKGRFIRGRASIDVSGGLRIVTDETGLSVQVTPVYDFASVAVVNLSLDRIEVKSTRDVEFFYFVQGVRKAFKDRRPIVAEAFPFVPNSPDDRLESVYTEDSRRRLANGTFSPDGTVNMRTAERMGWVRLWRERAAEAVPKPAP